MVAGSATALRNREEVSSRKRDQQRTKSRNAMRAPYAVEKLDEREEQYPLWPTV